MTALEVARAQARATAYSEAAAAVAGELRNLRTDAGGKQVLDPVQRVAALQAVLANRARVAQTAAQDAAAVEVATGPTLPDPSGGCSCTPGPATDWYEPDEVGYDPACPEHSTHVYNPRTGVWDLAGRSNLHLLDQVEAILRDGSIHPTRLREKALHIIDPTATDLSDTDKPRAHQLSISTTFIAGRYTAECTCGWRGLAVSTESAAVRDAELHDGISR